MILLLILLAWSTSFIAFNFWGLCLNEGEFLITEPIAWLRTLELILSVFIASGSIGLLMGYAFEKGRIYKLEKHNPGVWK